jgi:hypothetical protein
MLKTSSVSNAMMYAKIVCQTFSAAPLRSYGESMNLCALGDSLGGRPFLTECDNEYALIHISSLLLLLLNSSYLHYLTCSVEKYPRSLLIIAIGNGNARRVYEKIGYRDIYKRDYVGAGTGKETETETDVEKSTGKAEADEKVVETAQVLSDVCMSVMRSPGFDILILDL